jgi:hypothetical protein
MIKPILNDGEHQAMFNLMREAMSQVLAEENTVLEKALRESAVPPIEGPITKGKLKRRGIVMVTTNEGGIPRKWLEQRGKIISPVIVQSFGKI